MNNWQILLGCVLVSRVSQANGILIFYSAKPSPFYLTHPPQPSLTDWIYCYTPNQIDSTPPHQIISDLPHTQPPPILKFISGLPSWYNLLNWKSPYLRGVSYPCFRSNGADVLWMVISMLQNWLLTWSGSLFKPFHYNYCDLSKNKHFYWAKSNITILSLSWIWSAILAHVQKANNYYSKTYGDEDIFTDISIDLTI